MPRKVIPLPEWIPQPDIRRYKKRFDAAKKAKKEVKELQHDAEDDIGEQHRAGLGNWKQAVDLAKVFFRSARFKNQYIPERASTAKEIKTALRYGRRSGTRGNSYTMVFSRLCPPGRAKLVPYSHAISTLQDLIGEAECLWKAEEPQAEAHRIASNWGCVAVLCNPERNIPEDVLRGWAERVSQEADYGRVSQTHDEGILVGRNDGLLRIAWPRCGECGAAADFDLLLVTANDPRITAVSPTYPTAEAIAEAWNGAGQHVEYFWKNTENGICTFEDAQIRTRLHPRKQGCL